ncbi:MAG: hypothetical protein NW214_03465 [Pseudanabaenaceae cyanobacterium bins.39]|nr:hypothetical protein [Pseudanabaenaceae cyanobacterium bins.39]
MKNPFVYRALQITSVLTIYSVVYIWASTAHVEIVSEILDSLDSLLLALAIAVILPVICFKVLSKLANRPAFLDRQANVSSPSKFVSTSDQGSADSEDIDPNLMQYRGIWYKPEDIASDTASQADQSDEGNSHSEEAPNVNRKSVVKYRGVDVEISNSKASDPSNETTQDAPNVPKSAKTRVKYRGAYLD